MYHLLLLLEFHHFESPIILPGAVTGQYHSISRVTAGVFVADEPLYPHRGVMLDTSRNFYGVDDLLRLIKAMSMNKLNVFHWHITDSHSFPLVVEPELAGKVAYGEEMKYSPEDVKAVMEYGMDHGVRVLPEIDMPARGDCKSMKERSAAGSNKASTP